MESELDIDPIVEIDEDETTNEADMNVTKNPESRTILQSIILLEDAINFRSIYHKLDERTSIIYRCYYSKSIQAILNLNIFVLLILAFFETPSSLSMSSDITQPFDLTKRYEFSCGILETIDLFCLLLFLCDSMVKTYLIGKKQALHTPWLIAYYIVIVVSIMDCSVSLMLTCKETIRIRRYLRPFFLIQCSSLMKKTIKCLKRTLPQIISVFVLLLIHIYFFALIGMHIFPRFYLNRKLPKTNSTDGTVPNKVFSSITDSLINLLILVTTSNNPDVMMQSYSENRFAALFYVIYVLIGIYVIMSLITAVIYNHFKGFFQDSILSSAFRQAIAIRATFWVLYREFGNTNNDCIPKHCVSCVIKNLNSLSDKIKERLLIALNDLNTIRSENEILETSSDITMKQFDNLLIYNLNNDFEEDDDTDNNVDLRYPSHDYKYYIHFIKIKLRGILTHRYFMYASCFLTLINIIVITVELHYLDRDYNDTEHVLLAYILLVFAIYYLFENILKLWSIKWKKYSQSYTYVADGVITIVLVILHIVHFSIFGRPYVDKKERDEMTGLTVWGLSRVVNMLMIFRLINLVPSIKVMYAIVSTCIDIIRSLRPLFGILIVIYYIFALFGMQLFQNRIKIDSFDQLYNQSDPDSYCGTYKQLDYWSNNFDDFYSSLIVLWNIMVLNSWQNIFQAFVDVTNEAAILYFLAWWVLCVLITLNMCISFVLDLFIMKWEKVSQINDRGNNRRILIKSMHQLFNDSKWRPDENKLNEALLKHRYFNFRQIVKSFDTVET